MSQQDYWLLPEGIEEVLPKEAKCVEILRRNILDLFETWGYRLVIPPIIDFLDSLLTGTGHEFDLQTFKLTDQISGRLLGIRADMTPQVARIDAHKLKQDVPLPAGNERTGMDAGSGLKVSHQLPMDEKKNQNEWLKHG